MRVTSQMQSTSLVNMQSSQTYKNYTKKVENDDKSTETDDVKHVTNNVVVEKKDDTYVLSKIDETYQKTLLTEIKANTKIGLELSQYFSSESTTELQDTIKQVNQTINTMSLADYI